MNNKNCPNCGAPLEPGKSKCAYCNISYFDLCSVNIDEMEPFYLKFKMRGKIYIALVVADPDVTLEMRHNNVYACAGNHDPLACSNVLETTIDLRFRSVFTSGARKCLTVEVDNGE